MMKVDEFIKKCEKLTKVPTVYMYGAWGQFITQKFIDEKAKQYPDWYTEERQKMLQKHINKSFGFDCVCTIKSILWGFDFDETKPNGGAVYGSNKVKDVNADMFYNMCNNKSSNFKNIEVGALVHMQGHVGVYIGNGKCIECTPRHKNGVQLSTIMNVTGNVPTSDFLRKWENWGLIPYVDYNIKQKKTEIEDLKLLLNSMYNILNDAKRKNLF